MSSTVRFLQQENIRLQQQLQQLEKENRALSQQFLLLGRLLDAIPVIAQAESQLAFIGDLFQQVLTAIGAGDGSISRLLPRDNQLVFLIVEGELKKILPGYQIQADAGIAGWVVANEASIIVNEPQQDWRFSHTIDDEFGFLTRSIVSAPIMDDTGLIGVIQLLNKKNNGFNDIDLVLISMLSKVVAPVLGQLALPSPPDAPDMPLI
jgi:GAF domain-containing protein